jgi:hypothetical protein
VCVSSVSYLWRHLYPPLELIIYVSFKTFGHVITLYLCGTVFGIHSVIACVLLDPGAHVINAFGFVFKTGCDMIHANTINGTNHTV